MTSAEWAAAADRGNPETLGRALVFALQQAYVESQAARVARDIGELAPGFDRDVIEPLMTRAGELLREQGWIAPQLPASRDFPTDQDDQRG